MQRLVIPSLEREIRRDLTEQAEDHAIRVFARNLRGLLLQPPLRRQRILGIDPGFRSGCKIVALDECGDLLDHGMVHLIGSDDRCQKGRAKLVELVNRHGLKGIAIGNGTACRETERLVADVLANELHETDVAYAIVNEAGASVYSTSQVGREELPNVDATLRGAVSIGRRLQDPLSELVKINPANIGVGLYQHDIKSNELHSSLDHVVESCVNRVGVDLNTASPSLLRYVSGLNQLTARRIVAYRAEHGGFRRREQLKEVPGIGEATFVQAAGFLKLPQGENPLDATWIHPESYGTVEKILEHLGIHLDDLVKHLVRARAGSAPTDGDGQAEPTGPTTDAATTPSSDPSPPGTESNQAETSPVASTDSAEAVCADGAESPQNVEGCENAGNADSAQPDSVTPTPEETEATAHGPTANETTDATTRDVTLSETRLAETASSDTVSSDTASSDTVSRAESDVSAQTEALRQRIEGLNSESIAEKLGVGTLTLSDILTALSRPPRDPRDDLPQPVFRREIIKLDDLKPGMQLAGTVLNVVDFGAFVDIGLSDCGLVHVSRLADRFVDDPHAVVAPGDVLQVWVISVDKERRRVSLTAVQPGTEKPRPARGTGGEGATRRGGHQRGSGKRESGQRDGGQQGSGGHRAGGRRGSGRGRGGTQGRRRNEGGERSGKSRVRNRPPKPVVPITEAMKQGKEPMRTFSDLMQYYEDDKKPDNKSK